MKCNETTTYIYLFKNEEHAVLIDRSKKKKKKKKNYKVRQILFIYGSFQAMHFIVLFGVKIIARV